MTLEKFFETLKLIVDLDSHLKLQTTLELIRDNLTQLVSSPAVPQYQTSLATNLAVFQKAAAQLQGDISPSQKSSLAEIGGSEYFDPAISEQVRDSIALNAMTPSVAKEFVTGLSLAVRAL